MTNDELNSTSKKSENKNYIIRLWIFVFAPVFALLLIFLLTVLNVFGDLPDVEELQNPKSNLATAIYSSDGKI